MITATIVENKSGKMSRKLVSFNNSEKAKKELSPIAHEMCVAKSKKVEPKRFIDAVSYDTRSEKLMLIEIGALKLEQSIVPDDDSKLIY